MAHADGCDFVIVLSIAGYLVEIYYYYYYYYSSNTSNKVLVVRYSRSYSYMVVVTGICSYDINYTRMVHSTNRLLYYNC